MGEIVLVLRLRRKRLGYDFPSVLDPFSHLA